MFWWEFGLSSASRNHISTFSRPSIHYACLRLCSAIVHFIRINCLYFVCSGWSAQALTALATLTISVAWYCCTSTKTAFFNIEAFRNLITPQQRKRKTKSLLDFHRVPPPRGALLGLAPPEKAPIHPKLKYETLHNSGMFVKFECQAPLERR